MADVDAVRVTPVFILSPLAGAGSVIGPSGFSIVSRVRCCGGLRSCDGCEAGGYGIFKGFELRHRNIGVGTSRTSAHVARLVCVRSGSCTVIKCVC